MLCWSWFNNIKMADWMFIAGGSLIRLNKKPVPGGCFRDERQKWQKLACFKGWHTALRSPDPLPCLFCPQLFMATQPLHLVILALCCQVVFVFMVLICAHVWYMSGYFSVTSPDVLEELWGSGLYFLRWSTEAQLHFNSWKSPKLAGMSVLFCKNWKKVNAENSS